MDNLNTGDKRRNIIHYVLPSVGAMFVSYLYVVVDGIFVGQGIGAVALASVNIAVPFTEIMTALVSMITIGGAAVTAIRLGRGNVEQANEAFMTSALLIVIAAAGTTSLGIFLPEQIARLFGATDALIAGTVDYIRWYSVFSIFFALSVLLSVFVRNDGAPRLAFWGMIAGAVGNIFLDWLFIFPLQMGIMGAAIASGLGQAFSFIVLATHFFRKRGVLRFRLRGFRLKRVLSGKVLKRGLPEFVVQMSMPVTVFCFNQAVLNYMGEDSLSAFAIISYLLNLLLGIFFGVSQGVQPLIGKSFGERKFRDADAYFRAGVAINLALSAGIYLLLLPFGHAVLKLFTMDAAIVAEAYQILVIYGLSFLPASVNIVYTTYFLSTQNTAQALAVAVGRGLSLNVLFIFLIPVLLGGAQMWWAMVCAECITMMMAFAMRAAQKKRIQVQLDAPDYSTQ